MLSAVGTLPAHLEICRVGSGMTISPDWLRIGTDITHQGPFNAAFSLTGTTVPESSTWAMLLLIFAGPLEIRGLQAGAQSRGSAIRFAVEIWGHWAATIDTRLVRVDTRS